MEHPKTSSNNEKGTENDSEGSPWNTTYWRSNFVCVWVSVCGYLIMPLCSSCHTWILSSHWSLLSLCWSRTLKNMRHQSVQKSCREKTAHTAQRHRKKIELTSLNNDSVTSEGVAVHWTGSLVCGLPYCSQCTWPALHRRPGGQPSLEGSRYRRLGFPPSPAGRTAAAWHPGLTPLTHPQGRIWHGTWTAVGFPSSHPGPSPKIKSDISDG